MRVRARAFAVGSAAAERASQERPLLQPGSDLGWVDTPRPSSKPGQHARGAPSALCGGPGSEPHSSLLDADARGVGPGLELVWPRPGPVLPPVCASAVGQVRPSPTTPNRTKDFGVLTWIVITRF